MAAGRSVGRGVLDRQALSQRVNEPRGIPPRQAKRRSAAIAVPQTDNGNAVLGMGCHRHPPGRSPDIDEPDPIPEEQPVLRHKPIVALAARSRHRLNCQCSTGLIGQYCLVVLGRRLGLALMFTAIVNGGRLHEPRLAQLPAQARDEDR